jgi:hypothetical protein
MEFLIYILVGWGITDFLVNGSILDKIRVYLLVKFPMLGKLFSCIRCSGFWVGILMGLISFLDFNSFFLWEYSNFWGIEVVASGFLISGSSVIINGLLFFFYSRIQPGEKINLFDEEQN